MFQELENSTSTKFYNKNFNKYKLYQGQNSSYSLKFSQRKHTQQIKAMVRSMKVLKKQIIERDDDKDEDDII